VWRTLVVTSPAVASVVAAVAADFRKKVVLSIACCIVVVTLAAVVIGVGPAICCSSVYREIGFLFVDLHDGDAEALAYLYGVGSIQGSVLGVKKRKSYFLRVLPFGLDFRVGVEVPEAVVRPTGRCKGRLKS